MQRDQGSTSEGFVWAALFLFLVSPPALVIGIILWQWSRRRLSRGTGLGLGLGALLCWLVLFLARVLWLGSFGSLWRAVVVAPSLSGMLGSLLQIWAWGLFLAPTAAILFFAVPTAPVDQFQRQQARLVAEEARHMRQAAKRLQEAGALPRLPGSLTLGAAVSGDLAWMQVGWVFMPAESPFRMAVIGESNAGKTETLLRLAVEARLQGQQVIYVDGKGDQENAERFLAAMQQLGCQRIAFFPAQHYDGWRGSGHSLYNRLLAIESYSERWYERVAQLILDLALNAPAGPALSSTEFLRRLRLSELLKLYKNKPEAGDVKALNEEAAQGVYLRYRAFFSTLGGKLDGSWAFEDVEAAYLLLDGLALKTEANSLGRFLLEEFAQYVSQRKPASQRTLFIFDELSAVQQAVGAATELFERARSFGASVVISSQSDVALGHDADRLLKAISALILHRYPAPEPLLERVGKVMALEQSWQQDNWGRPLGRDMLRQREVWQIPPNQVRRLGDGYAAVLSRGQAGVVLVARVPDLPPYAPSAPAASQPKPTRPLGPQAAPLGGNPGFLPPSQLPGTP